MLMDLTELHLEAEMAQEKLGKQILSTVCVLQANQSCFRLVKPTSLSASTRCSSAALKLEWKDHFPSTTKYFILQLTNIDPWSRRHTDLHPTGCGSRQQHTSKPFQSQSGRATSTGQALVEKHWGNLLSSQPSTHPNPPVQMYPFRKQKKPE